MRDDTEKRARTRYTFRISRLNGDLLAEVCEISRITCTLSSPTQGGDWFGTTNTVERAPRWSGVRFGDGLDSGQLADNGSAR